ncbi:hypothetical protein LBMAG42_29840 [Deltaproteobacteria bacterium]|nr:hypothetical protein LBMAG42_29840 [Deltaproteobacteria bacterium]
MILFLAVLACGGAEAPSSPATPPPEAAPAPAPAPTPVALSDADAAALQAKVDGGKAEDLLAMHANVLEYLYYAKEKPDGSGYEDGQAIAGLANSMLMAEKNAIVAAPDEASKRKLIADFAGPLAKTLASAKSHVIVDFVAYTPGCGMVAGSPAAADEVAGALGNTTADVHSALIGCLFQSGPQTLSSYFSLTDDVPARSARLGKALAATQNAASVADFIGRLPMFEVAPGTDALGDALVGKFSPADTALDAMIGQTLLSKCNVKQLADYSAKVAALADPGKSELTPMAADWSSQAAATCK